MGPVEWDTGKRVWEARECFDDRFVLLYSDNLVPFPMEKMLSLHQEHKLPLTLMVAPKLPGNIILDENGILQNYDYKRSSDLGFVEIGYMIVEKQRTLTFFQNPNCNFSSILKRMAAQQQISAWIQHDAYHSISDKERWMKAEEYLKPKKILLIDRDGVINLKAPKGEYITSCEDFKWIPETREGMKQLAKDGFRFIVISNQAGIARGMIDPDALTRINKMMKDELLKDGIEILDIYVCPHHWEDNCLCRKPNPGMLLQASKEHLLRLDRTVFIGDDPRDVETAWNAGCKAILLGDSSDITSVLLKKYPHYATSYLTASLEFIRKHYNPGLQ